MEKGMQVRIEAEREEDGRYLAEAPAVPGALAYGATQQEAVRRVQALVLRVIADRLEHNESAPELPGVFAIAA
jgi:predicted RNase H-like HicB family nuclease